METKTLEQLRAEAYAAFTFHKIDMKTSPTYAKAAKAERRKELKATQAKFAKGNA